MSDLLNAAVETLASKLGDKGFDGSAKFEIEDHGAIIIDGAGVRVSDDETDVTLSATSDVFQGILSGDVNPTLAFMSGKLRVSGDMGAAMRLGSILS